MKTAAVIPVKRFSRAKTRLGLDDPARIERLCGMMLREVLQTLVTSPRIHHTFVVTRDEEAARITSEYGAAKSGKNAASADGGGSGAGSAGTGRTSVIYDKYERGVNEAVALADREAILQGYDASIVIPQDIPYIKTQDIDFVMGFASPPNFAVIVPSRKFDGTNALVRMPIDVMGTHYDNDSYREHVKMANRHTRNASSVFVRRMMMDLDTPEDVEYLLANREKPRVADAISEIVSS